MQGRGAASDEKSGGESVLGSSWELEGSLGALLSGSVEEIGI